jgi:hypothetical protein
MPSCARFEETDYQGENVEESNVKGFGFHLRHNPHIFLEGLRKTTKTSLQNSPTLL